MRAGKYSENGNYACLLISFAVYDFLIGGKHHGSVAHSGSC